MSSTLTYQRKKPDASDDSTSWMSDLEDNIDLDDAHTHDGVTSPLLSAGAVGKDFITKSTADWGILSGIYYPLTIPNSDIPSGFVEAGVPSSQKATLAIMDTDNNDERVYLKYTWSGTGSSCTITIYSTVKLNLKILFI